MLNKEKTKVLFAEAGSDFADVLLSFLTFPLGRIVKVLEKHYGDKAPVLGSITSLYKGLANLDTLHFSTSAAKQMLLHPKSLYYENSAGACSCGSLLNKEVVVHVHEGGGFTSKTASFIISDDLRMMPYTTGFVSTLTNLGITAADAWSRAKEPDSWI
ncbi:hypothetical protein ACS0TY_008206 [Phlomoides rotata]